MENLASRVLTVYAGTATSPLRATKLKARNRLRTGRAFLYSKSLQQVQGKGAEEEVGRTSGTNMEDKSDKRERAKMKTTPHEAQIY